jgi:hypothetical protein
VRIGKIVPHGIYDPTANAGWVSIGITHDTAEFAVTSIRTWIAQIGRQRYPDMRELTTMDPAGNRKLDKGKARFRIDGAVALAMAMGLRARDRENNKPIDIEALIA